MRGLRSKVVSVYNNSAVSSVDIYALSETWLTDDVSDSELFSQNYVVYRKNRDYLAMNVNRGGGVLLSIKNKFNCTVLDLSRIHLHVPSVDILGVKLNSHHLTLTILVVYIPPTITFTNFSLFFDLLNELHLLGNKDVLFLGDFNVPTYFLNAANDNFSTVLKSFEVFHQLKQANTILNVNHNMLDLVFTNTICSVDRAIEPLVDIDQHHPALAIEIKLLKMHPLQFRMNNLNSYNFKKANFPLLYNLLQSIDWGFLDQIFDVDNACSAFYDTLHSVFAVSIPKAKPVMSKRIYPPWFDRELIKTLLNKNKAARLYRKYDTVSFYNSFKSYRTRSKILMKTAYNKYINNIENNIQHDPKSFWSFIKTKRGQTRIPGILQYNNVEISSPDGIVNAFGDYFKSVYIDSTPSNFCGDIDCNEFNSCITISNIPADDIYLALKKCNNNFTSGPDNIPSFLLKDCASIFMNPLHKIFNLIIKQQTVPKLWKEACITPVFKKGDVSEISNYRPISLMCNFAKIFEKTLYKQIYSSVKYLISPYQHGFIEKRSTITNLTIFSQFVSEAINDKTQVDVIYTDFQKAFDQIDHYILLNKLHKLGFSNSLLCLLRSYIFDRCQFVRYRNFSSNKFYPTSGVPQGSNLGPLLFILFINDITNYITVEKLLFADDLKLYTKVKSDEDCLILQKNIDLLAIWCERNKLRLNVSKCVVNTYTNKLNAVTYSYKIGDKQLRRSDTVKDLGIIFDKKFTFIDHINYIVTKSYKMYGFIYRNCSNFSNIKALCCLYKSLVRSILEYGVLVWYPIFNNHIKQIESVQRKFLKFLCYLQDGVYPVQGFDHVVLLSRFQLKSLSSRRIVTSIKFLVKLTNNDIDCLELLSNLNFNVPQVSTRFHSTFYVNFNRTNVLRKSPISIMCELCNNYTNSFDIYCDSLHSIVKALNNIVL